MLRSLALAAAAVLMLGAAKAQSVDYRLGITPQADTSPLLAVEIRFRGDPDGETRLKLPDNWAGTTAAWRFLSDIKVQGATVTEDGPAVRVLRHRPNAPIIVRYSVRTGYDVDPKGGKNPYDGPMIRPTWVDLLGELVFAFPEGRDDKSATFRWGALPPGWRAVSDLEHGGLKVSDIPFSLTFGGAVVRVTEHPIPEGVLRVAGLADGPFGVEALGADIARVIATQRRFWADVKGPFLVTAIPLTWSGKGTSVGGTGRGDGFALYGTPNGGERLREIISHEHIHTWIPGRIGRMPEEKDEAALYWLSEGFTDFFAYRTLLREGVATPDVIVRRMSSQIAAYAKSTARNATSAEIVANAWTNRDHQQVSYQRGLLLALKWDEEIRRKTAGSADLDDVVLRMRDSFQAAPDGRKPDIASNLVDAAQAVAQLDLRPDITRYAVAGETVALPGTLFDGCLESGGETPGVRLATGLSGAALATCGRKIGGL